MIAATDKYFKKKIHILNSINQPICGVDINIDRYNIEKIESNNVGIYILENTCFLCQRCKRIYQINPIKWE